MYSLEAELFKAELREALSIALLNLPSQEQKIMRAHYEDNKSFRRIAAEVHVSYKEIIKIWRRGLRRLRHPNQVRKLKSYLDLLSC